MLETLVIARSVADLRTHIANWRKAGDTVALVPTMGALHDGHLSLVRQAQAACHRVVVSVFVNPTQFGPAEDLSRYPRQESEDAAALASLGTDLLYAPGVEDIYPDGFSTTVHVAKLTQGLCGPLRPGHFDGVATVVAKLLLQCLPDMAVFGEKDYQQLQVIRRMVRDLDLPVRIEAGPTVRDSTGLALSSRNAYLSDAERQIAQQFNRILRTTADRLRQCPSDVERVLASAKTQLCSAGFQRIDYLEVCDTQTLEPLATIRRPARLLGAVHVGSTRLIDNMAIEEGLPA